MSVYIEVWGRAGRSVAPIERDQVSIGRDPGNDIVVDDESVSQLHAVIERLGPGWCIRDLGSRNGTFLDGDRILSERPLRAGQEIRIGSTRMLFRWDVPRAPAPTKASEPPPDLTRREREILEALCAPVAGGDVFTDPASIKEMAAALFVTEAAVKQHLSRLYQKFDILDDGPDRRRVRLANEAVRRGAVNLADLRDRHPGT